LARIHKEEMAVSSISVPGKLDSYMSKTEVGTFSNTIYKDKLKKGSRSLIISEKQIKTPRRKHRQNII